MVLKSFELRMNSLSKSLKQYPFGTFITDNQLGVALGATAALAFNTFIDTYITHQEFLIFNNNWYGIPVILIGAFIGGTIQKWLS
jgi:surface polysaccharide O-acyltransferase-like enzyme